MSWAWPMRLTARQEVHPLFFCPSSPRASPSNGSHVMASRRGKKYSEDLVHATAGEALNMRGIDSLASSRRSSAVSVQHRCARVLHASSGMTTTCLIKSCHRE